MLSPVYVWIIIMLVAVDHRGVRMKHNRAQFITATQSLQSNGKTRLDRYARGYFRVDVDPGPSINLTAVERTVRSTRHR